VDALDQKRFTIVLPTLNEAENIQPMLEALDALYPEATLLVMDDNSRDGTADIARSFARRRASVEVVTRDRGDKGLSASIFEGIEKSRTEFFVVMDADFQHPPAAVKGIMESLLRGNDLAVGVRQDKMSLPFMRKMASIGANKLAASCLMMRRRPSTEDNMSGFFGGRTDICAKIAVEHAQDFERRGFKALFDLLKYLPRDTRIEEVRFHFDHRRGGESKLSSSIIFSILRQCGYGGKAVAAAASFLLTNMVGRFLFSVLLGLAFTFGIMLITGVNWDRDLVTATIWSIALASVYIVLANQLVFTHGRRDGLALGVKLVFTGFSGYLLNLAVFYSLFYALPSVQVVSSLLGFGIAYMWNTVGASASS
jgi:dolichol-phosphate mannosyltransferase